MDGADPTCDNNVWFVVVILLLFLIGILVGILIFSVFGPAVDHSGGVDDYWTEPLQNNKSDGNDDLAGRGGQQPYGLGGGGGSGGEVSLDP